MIAILGILCMTIVGFQITRFFLKFFYNNFLGPYLGINAVNLSTMGKWAVVTGCTDGLGKAYAEKLAKKGLSVVLISRNQSKLDTLAEEIEGKYNVETKTIAADFTDLDKIYYDIEKQLIGLDIGVLINNVGMSYSYPEYFVENKDKDKLYANIINCNIYSVTNMCKLVLPKMLEKKRGVIVNVSSLSALISSPLLTVYAASKSYVDKFTEDLATEYSKSGITFQCLFPGYVATKMSKIRTSTWMAPSPSKYVDDAIRTIGVQQHTTGYFPHTLLLSVITLLNYCAPDLAKWIIIRTQQNIRARSLRKNQNNLS